MKGKALGRGLSALIPGADENGNLLQIPLSSLIENPLQPRIEMDLEALRELAASISENGVIQPIAVRKIAEGYQLISGARRVKAAELAGLRTIPAVLIEVKDEAELLELALVENLQREDLNPLEQAQGYRRLIEEYGWTQEKVAQKVGKERPTVANILRLLKLPEPIKQGLRRGEINMGHARALVSVENEQDALALFQRTIREGLNVRKLEKIISRLGKTIDRKRPLIIKSPYISELEDRLRKLYATKVNIAVKSKGGVIEISYYSEEDLERIMEMLQKVNEEEWKIVDRE